MTATIKNVAKAANVSVASVSRALNGLDNVNPQTRQRIVAAAKRLGYVPNSAARSLITRRTQTVGALLPDLHGEFFSELIRGIDVAARARNLHLLLSSSHGSADEAASAVRAMRGKIDGLLVMSPYADADFLADNLPPTLPAILMNTGHGDSGHPWLAVDNYGGAFAMTQHLLARGHRRITFICGPESNTDAQERLRGYCDAMEQHADGAETHSLPGDFLDTSGYQAGLEILNMTPRPQAVFAANDMMAVGCLSAFREAGVHVPQDIALAGFDDIPIARYVTPALSTVRVRIADFGRLALERLADVLEHPERKSPPADTFGFEIVKRETCGANNPRSKSGSTSQPSQQAPRGKK